MDANPKMNDSGEEIFLIETTELTHSVHFDV